MPGGGCEQVSGDFYDLFEMGPGDWMVAIGDVSGKGFDAPVRTVLVRDKEYEMKTGPVWMAAVLIGLAATFFITLIAVVLDWINLS